MGSSRPWFVLAVALVPAGASADNHFADFATNFSLTQGSLLKGGQLTASKLVGHRPDWSPPGPPFKPVRLAIVLDLNGAHGTHHLATVTELGGAGGLRLTLAERHNFRFLPFAHTLFGRNHNTGSTLVRNHWSFVFGGGLDVLTNPKRPHVKKTVSLLAFRFQGDWTEPVGENANGYYRLSVGPVFRIGEHPFDHP